MKRLILTLFMGLLCFTYQAKTQQTVIDPSNLTRNIKSAAQNSATATSIVKPLQEGIKIYNQSKAYYNTLKSVHNIIKDARRAKLAFEMVSRIMEIYTSGFNRMVLDPNFTMDELATISAGYARLLEGGGALMMELKAVITGGNGLLFSDRERMDIIDQVYTRMLEYRNLTRYYTRRAIPVSLIRSREKGDAHQVLAPYRSPDDRH